MKIAVTNKAESEAEEEEKKEEEEQQTDGKGPK